MSLLPAGRLVSPRLYDPPTSGCLLGHIFNDFLAGTMVAPSTAVLHWYLQNLKNVCSRHVLCKTDSFPYGTDLTLCLPISAVPPVPACHLQSRACCSRNPSRYCRPLETHFSTLVVVVSRQTLRHCTARLHGSRFVNFTSSGRDFLLQFSGSYLHTEPSGSATGPVSQMPRAEQRTPASQIDESSGNGAPLPSLDSLSLQRQNCDWMMERKQPSPHGLSADARNGKV